MNGFPKQTTELLIAVAALMAATIAAKADDGRISATEALGIAAKNSGKILAGITGLSEIDDELKTIDDEQLEAMAREIMPELEGVVSGDALDVIDNGVNALAALVTFARSVHQLRNPPPDDPEPPRAELLPEEMQPEGPIANPGTEEL